MRCESQASWTAKRQSNIEVDPQVVANVLFSMCTFQTVFEFVFCADSVSGFAFAPIDSVLTVMRSPRVWSEGGALSAG
jgi:hypothetical protein